MKIDRAVIEVNGGCNYSCNMCPQSYREKEFKVQMSLEDFEKVVKDAAQYGLNVVNLDGSGEATQVKNLPEYIKIVKKYGAKAYIFSNGLNMKGQFMKDCVDVGLDYFRFSVIGYDRFTYQKWMNKDSFLDIIENIKEMKKYINETNSDCTVATYSLIDEPRMTQYEIKRYRELLEPLDVKIEIWRMHNWSGVVDINQREGEIRTCGRPFAPEITVRAGGIDGHKLAVHPCCQVMGNDSKAVLGHLDTNTIEEVMNGEEYEHLRNGHNSGNYPEYCRNCDFLLDDPEVLVYTNYGRKVHKMVGTEFELEQYR